MKEPFKIGQLLRDTMNGLKPYSSARDEYADSEREMVFLDANENPFGKGLNRYPDPRQRVLKQQIAALKSLEPEQLFLGNGSDEVLDLLYRAFCNPGRDNVITMPPTYGMYGVLAAINGVEERQVLLSSSFEPRLEEVFKKVDSHSKLLFLCSPNNPTGNLFSPEVVIEILDRFPGLVVIDEAYIDFASEASWLKRLGSYPNLVVVQTFSKAYGMAGIRLGMAWAHREIIDVLNKIKPPYNINELTQAEAQRRLADTERVEEEIRILLSQRDLLESELKELRLVQTVFPSQANFLLVRVDQAERRYRQLLDHGVVVRSRSNQPLCENTLRITVGNPQENRKLINILKLLDQ